MKKDSKYYDPKTKKKIGKHKRKRIKKMYTQTNMGAKLK